MVHPHPAYPRRGAIAHDVLRDRRTGHDDDAVHTARNGLQVGVAGIAFEAFHVRIHREHVVPGLLQTSIDEIARRMFAVVARHAGNRDAPLRKKFVDLRWSGHVWRAAAQIVSMSVDESRASGCSEIQALPGILFAETSAHDATSSWRCRSAG